jgi:hypothetical protein
MSNPTNIPPIGAKIEKGKRGRPRSERSGRALAEGAGIGLRTAQRYRLAQNKICRVDNDKESFERMLAIALATPGRIRVGMYEKLALLPVERRKQVLTWIEEGVQGRDAYERMIAVMVDEEPITEAWWADCHGAPSHKRRPASPRLHSGAGDRSRETAYYTPVMNPARS